LSGINSHFNVLIKVLKLTKNPRLLFIKLKERFLFNYFPKIISNDFLYLKIYYRLRTGKNLNLKNPKTFNEKTQWLKLYDRKPEYLQMADKYHAIEFVSQRIENKYIIPLLGVWNCFDEINFDSLPNQFVLKCTHDSGGVVICRDKANSVFVDKTGAAIDIDDTREKLTRSLKRNYSIKAREWAYKNENPKIIAQELIKTENDELLMDYKVFTFNGKPKLIQAHIERSAYRRIANFYTTDWNFQDFSIEELCDKNYHIEKPRHLDKMLELAEILAQNTYFLRVDFFYINDRIYFGEFAFYNHAGFGKFIPESNGELLGSFITLPLQV